MSDDIEHLEAGLGHFDHIQGLIRGGPFDGAEFAIECPRGIPLTGVRLTIGTGADADSREWHVYNLRNRMRNDHVIEGEFVHIGKLEGDPTDLPPES